MNDRQKKLLEKLNLKAEDFEPKKDEPISNEERLTDLELAICELLDVLGTLE